LQELTDITGDIKLNKHFSQEGAIIDERDFPITFEEDVALAILHPRRNVQVDDLIDLIQRNFFKTTMWGNVGGKIGEQMVRAAFAPILRFSGLIAEFKSLVELYSIELSLQG
jgi:hypothetical protein